MWKKIGLWTLIAGLSGLLIWGAVNRTMAKSDDLQAGNAQGQGQGRQAQAEAGLERVEQNDPAGRGGWRNSSALAENSALDEREAGKGRGRSGQEGGYESPAEPLVEADHAAEWEDRQGLVISLDESMMELILEGEEILVVEGRAWSYAQEIGFVAEIGDEVVVSGFLEDGEFVAGALENLTTGQAVVLREESGRPLWAGGRGRRGA